MRRLMLVVNIVGLTLAVAGCKTDASERPASGQVSSTRVVSRPDSCVVAFDAPSNRLFAFSPERKPLWAYELPKGEGLVGAISAAPDSGVYLRTHKAIVSLDFEGKLRWRRETSGTTPAAVASPAAMTNSGVVYAAQYSLVAVGPDGVDLWRYDLPAKEELISGPVVSTNGAITIMTQIALRQLRPDGSVAWEAQLSRPTGTP